MPASYVHQCIAAEAAARLSIYPQKELNAALRAGAEGPDPFFYSLLPGSPYPPLVANTMHASHTAGFLMNLARRADSDLLRAYVCGFLSHYATDTNFHPYVYAHTLTAEHRPSGTLHCTLEHQWETMLFRRQGHAKGLPRQMAGFAELSVKHLDVIADALAPAIAETYPESAIPRSRVRRALSDAVGLCDLLRSVGGKKYSVMGAVLSPFKLDAPLHAHMMPLTLPDGDLTNAAHAPWFSLWEPFRERTEGFDELYEASILRSMELMRCATGYWNGRVAEASLRALHGDLSYNSGLLWEKTSTPDEAAAEVFG